MTTLEYLKQVRRLMGARQKKQGWRAETFVLKHGRQFTSYPHFTGERIKTTAYVEKECRQLCEQAIAAERE
jgi:hypothetical protein